MSDEVVSLPKETTIAVVDKSQFQVREPAADSVRKGVDDCPVPGLVFPDPVE